MNRLFLLLFGAVTFVAHAQVPDYVPTEGLVAWYPFNGNANDESGNGNDGVLVGPQLTNDRFGSNQAAFAFESSRIEIPNSPGLDQFKTISFWFLSNSNSGNQVAFKQNIYMGHVHERVNCAINWGGSTHLAVKEVCGAPWQYDNVAGTLNNGVWHHYAGVLDTAQKRLYIDGVLLDESNFIPDSMCSGGDLIIGQEWDGLPHDFIGDLDDFGFWNRALTESEILALYNAQMPAPGCTDSAACNYDAEATSDDGNCEFCSCLSQPTVAAGYGTNYAINTLGQVYGWGGNNLGQTDIPDNLVGVQQIEGGEEFCILLHADSSVQVIGSNGPYGASVPAGMKGIDIAAGRHHMVVVEANGALTHIGPNYAGLTNEPVVSNAVDGAAGWYHNAGVLDNGAIVGWGNAWVEPETPITNAVEIEAGNGHNIVLTSEHTIIEWGGDIGSMSVWDTLTNVVDIAAGWNRSLALMSDGTILAWSPQSGNIIIDRDEYSGVIDADIEHNAIIILLENGEIVTVLDVPEEVEIITPGWSNCDLCLADADGDGICNDEEGPCNENPDPCLCDDIVVYGCVDPEACNYTSEANCGDESCVYPPLGLSNCYDGETFCGDGTTWNPATQVCESIPCGTENTCPSDLNGNGMVEVSDLLMVLADFGSECAPPVAEWACGDPVNYHGYDYATVQIGEQCWFAENLRTELYSNGDSIPGGLSNEEWASTTDGAQAVSIYGDALEMFGRAYNGYAVEDERGLCLSGWHVALDNEWMEMEMELGMSESDANSGGWRGTDQGIQMKTVTGWSEGENGTNSSGFSVKPAGNRTSQGHWTNTVHNAFFWTPSSTSSPASLFRWLRFEEAGVFRGNYGAGEGLSIRCLKD